MEMTCFIVKLQKIFLGINITFYISLKVWYSSGSFPHNLMIKFPLKCSLKAPNIIRNETVALEFHMAEFDNAIVKDPNAHKGL
jgi:hypothetical protein